MKLVALALVLLSTASAAAQQAPGRERHKSPRTEPGFVTFVGFQKVGDAPRVFVRTTSAVTPQQAAAGDELVVTLPGFRLDMSNNGRPLDTRFFGTSVVRVRAVEVKEKGVEVHVTFAKGASEAKVSTAQSPPDDPGGGLYLYLDF
jgi:hypothetical protein